MMHRPWALQARQLSKCYGGRTVLRNVHFAVAAGETVVLTGANGAGKTTLLQCLAGALRPDRGEVRWYGLAARGNPRARRLVGVVADRTRLYPQLTLHENLVFAARMAGVRTPVRRAERLLTGIGLRGWAHCFPPAISRGMRQRLAIVRALVHDPRIVLLDEPFTGLDAAGVDWLTKVLEALRDRGRTICIASHDRRTGARLAARVVTIQQGKLHPWPAPEPANAEKLGICVRAA